MKHLFAHVVAPAVVLAVGVLAIRSAISGTRRRKTIGVGVLLLLVGMFVLQRVIAPSEEEKIERAIEVVATGTDPTLCDQKETLAYLEQTTGAKPAFADEICESEVAKARTDSVETSNIAIDGDRATALVANRGGSFDGSRLDVQLLREDGEWKLNRLNAFARLDRAGFDRAYRRSLLEFGSPARAVECAIRSEHRLSDASIERATLQGGDEVFIGIIDTCDREGVERNLIRGAADPEYGYPPAALECASERIEGSTDAELARLQLDIPAWGRLLMGCGRRAFFEHLRHDLDARGVDSATADCVLAAVRGRPTAGEIRVTYDEERFSTLIDACGQ